MKETGEESKGEMNYGECREEEQTTPKKSIGEERRGVNVGKERREKCVYNK